MTQKTKTTAPSGAQEQQASREDRIRIRVQAAYAKHLAGPKGHSLADLLAYVQSVQAAGKAGDYVALQSELLSSSARYRLEANVPDLQRFLTAIGHEVHNAIQAVDAEDAEAEARARAAIEAAEKAASEKEARRAELARLRALEAEFPEA